MCGGESERAPPCGSAEYICDYVGLHAWRRERGEREGEGGGEGGGERERNNPSSKPLDKHSTPIDRHQKQDVVPVTEAFIRKVYRSRMDSLYVVSVH